MVKTEAATFGAGCFWQVELIFSKTPGVTKTRVGYMGGDEKLFPNPSYEQVCSDRTGYAEAVQIEFNPKETDYSKLLEIFWDNHNPTTPNRQGPDTGTQYRSVIFYHSETQKKEAEISLRKAQKKFKNKIVTQIIKASTFYEAEEYHQEYLKKHGREYCHV